MTTFNPKDPQEDVVLTFRCADLLAGASLSACTLTSSPAGLELVGGPDLSAAPVVRHQVRGGVDGVDYTLRLVLTTSQGVRVASAVLPVRMA